MEEKRCEHWGERAKRETRKIETSVARKMLEANREAIPEVLNTWRRLISEALEKEIEKEGECLHEYTRDNIKRYFEESMNVAFDHSDLLENVLTAKDEFARCLEKELTFTDRTLQREINQVLFSQQNTKEENESTIYGEKKNVRKHEEEGDRTTKEE